MKRVEEELEKAVQKQTETMEQISNTVQEYLEELGDDKLSLSEFDKIEDGVIIYMTRKVDELY